MATIFMDESGDLGFDFTKEGTSKHNDNNFYKIIGKKIVEENWLFQ